MARSLISCALYCVLSGVLKKCNMCCGSIKSIFTEKIHLEKMKVVESRRIRILILI